jgi:hypothetical protein
MIKLAPSARKHKVKLQHLRYERVIEERRLSKLQTQISEKIQRESKPKEIRAA